MNLLFRELMSRETTTGFGVSRPSSGLSCLNKKSKGGKSESTVTQNDSLRVGRAVRHLGFDQRQPIQNGYLSRACSIIDALAQRT